MFEFFWKAFAIAAGALFGFWLLGVLSDYLYRFVLKQFRS